MESTGIVNGSLDNLLKNIEFDFTTSRQKDVYKTIVERVEKTIIEAALNRTFGNQIKAAKILGINRNTLRTKVKKLEINVDHWKI